MSKLILSDTDIKQAIATYYETHSTELYEKYDFENIDVRYEIDHLAPAENPFEEGMGGQVKISVTVEERK